MIFEKDNLSFRILDVLALDQRDVDMLNTGRNFHALSYRFRADTLLKTQAEVHHVSKDFVAFVPARLNYRRTATEDRLIIVHFETTDPQEPKIVCFKAEKPAVLGALFKRMLEIWNEKATGYTYRAAAVLYEILAECHAQHLPPPQTDSKIQGAVDYLLAHYRDGDLSIGALAERAFMSEVYFRRLFKAEYGTSPQKYLTALRLQHAAGLIATGYYSLKEVALLSGYRDYKYFSVEFKRAYGISPSAYSYNYGDERK